MMCCAVLSDMRLDIDHAHALAQELLRFSFTPVAESPTDCASNGAGLDFHAALTTALATYADNAAALLQTAHSMGHSAVNTLRLIDDTDTTFAADLNSHIMSRSLT